MRLKLKAFIVFTLLTLYACAGSDPSAPTTQSLAPATPDEECYCSVRKRQQVKKRLQQKEQLDQD